jgi:transcriptional regulator of aromatic amino acid metabolism
VYAHHVNVLLEGPETAIEPVVRQLLPHLRQPVVSIRSGTALSLPDMEIGTLIVDEVRTLTMEDQAHLLEWLNAASSPPRVISTSSQALFPCVELGLFAVALYYRLNVILMRIGSSNVGPLSRMRTP